MTTAAILLLWSLLPFMISEAKPCPRVSCSRNCSALKLADFRAAGVLDPEQLPLLCSALGIKREAALEAAWRSQLASVTWAITVMMRETDSMRVSREPGLLVQL